MLQKLLEGFIGTNQNVKKRDAWIEETIRSIPEGLRILDAGAGQGKWRGTCRHLNYVSQDFCQYNKANDNTFLGTEWEYNQIDIISDITSIPVNDGEFDAILCTEVLEHVPNPNDAIKELCRVLRPGGS